VLWPAAQWARQRGGSAALALALAAQAAVVAGRLSAWGEEDQHRHSYAAHFVLSRWPQLYEPHPDIFRDRTPALFEDGPHVFRDGAQCRKALARKRDATALEAACGRLPPDFVSWTEAVTRSGRGRSDWRYVTYAEER
jgi:hypothetical protein